MRRALRIYLCDLVHTTAKAHNYTVPLNIGWIASLTKERFGAEVDVTLFKYPDKAELLRPLSELAREELTHTADEQCAARQVVARPFGGTPQDIDDCTVHVTRQKRQYGRIGKAGQHGHGHEREKGLPVGSVLLIVGAVIDRPCGDVGIAPAQGEDDKDSTQHQGGH